DKHRAGGMSHGAFSHTANERTAQTGPPMRGDDNWIDIFLCSSLVDGRGAVSGNRRCIDSNAIEIDALQETLHLIGTSAPSCFDISWGIEITATRGHQNRAKISHVDDDNARTNLLREPNRIC